MALPKAKEIVDSTPVVIFSKTYCSYCTTVKKLLKELGASFKVIELNVEDDGSEMQSALAEWTGQRTVPSVFIGGKHIGGCDATTSLHRGGKLIPLLTEVGAVAKAETPGGAKAETPGGAKAETPGGAKAETPGDAKAETPGGAKAETPGGAKAETSGDAKASI